MTFKKEIPAEVMITSPKDVSLIKRAAMSLTPLAIECLKEIMEGHAFSPSARLKAAEITLAYGWGKPVSTNEVIVRETTRVVVDDDTAQKITDTAKRVRNILAGVETNNDLPELMDIVVEDLPEEPSPEDEIEDEVLRITKDDDDETF